MMVLQHTGSSVRKSLPWHLIIYNMHTNVGIFSLSYAAMPSVLVSVLFVDPYFIFKFIIFNILVRHIFITSSSLTLCLFLKDFTNCFQKKFIARFIGNLTYNTP